MLVNVSLLSLPLLTFEHLELENGYIQSSVFQFIILQGLAGSSSISYILFT